MALTNYVVIHRAVGTGARMFADTFAPAGAIGTESRRGRGAPVLAAAPPAPRETTPAPAPASVPQLFTRKTATVEGLEIPPVPDAPQRGATDLPPARWLFGQYNKFLPAKATCRALFNLLRDKPAGITVNDASSKISQAACSLGDYLLAFDERHDLGREDAFASAFPSSGVGNGGSRLRFANQFVANMKQNQLGGLPAAVRLVVVDEAREPRLTLTRAGAEFAALENPVLDGGADATRRKFSKAETEFLLAHISASVPEETSAYLAVIDAIQHEANTPDQVDAWLRKRFDLPKEDDITKTFLSTQRTGAISRMVDLGLVAREKSGLRVTYLVTEPGKHFTSQFQ